MRVLIVVLLLILISFFAVPYFFPSGNGRATNPFAARHTFTRSVSLRASQQFTLGEMPTSAEIRITSVYPVDIAYGDCNAGQTTNFQQSCEGGNALTITDSRVPFAALMGRFNNVTMTITY